MGRRKKSYYRTVKVVLANKMAQSWRYSGITIVRFQIAPKDLEHITQQQSHGDDDRDEVSEEEEEEKEEDEENEEEEENE